MNPNYYEVLKFNDETGPVCIEVEWDKDSAIGDAIRYEQMNPGWLTEVEEYQFSDAVYRRGRQEAVPNWKLLAYSLIQFCEELNGSRWLAEYLYLSRFSRDEIKYLGYLTDEMVDKICDEIDEEEKERSNECTTNITSSR